MSFSICGQVGANTGGIDCDVTKGLPVQLIVGSASFSAAEYVNTASFEVAFLASLILASGSAEKLFPFPVIQGNTAATTAAKTATLGYGLEIKLLASKQGYEFDVLAGSTLEKKLLSFDGQQVPVFILDKAKNMWGILSGTNFIAPKYIMSVEPKDFEDGNAVKTTKVKISIVDGADFSSNAAYMTTTFTPSDLEGLNDVVLYESAARASNVFKIGIKIPTASLTTSLNVHDTYATELASAARWVAKTGVGFGTTLVITSVASDPVNKGWTVTFDSSAFTALAALSKIQLSLVSPTVLAAADILGIESVPLVLTK